MDSARAQCEELVQAHRVTADGLAGSLEDAARRGLCDLELARRTAIDLLPRTAALDAGFTALYADRVVRRMGPVSPPVPVGAVLPLPYENLFEAERAFGKARRLALKTAQRIPGLSEFLGADEDL